MGDNLEYASKTCTVYILRILRSRCKKGSAETPIDLLNDIDIHQCALLHL